MKSVTILLFLWLSSPVFGAVTRLTWMHSERPAASLDVRLDGGAVVRSDENGAVDTGASRTIVVTDPETGLQLLEAAAGGDAAVRVPEPIRVSGRATGVSGALIVRIGDGPRATTATTDERRFTSGWIAADPPPFVVLVDERGNSASVDVQIPRGTRPRATVDIGTIALQPSAILEIAPDAGGVPSAELHVRNSTTAETPTAARELASLDRRDRRLYELLVRGQPYYFAADRGARILVPRGLTRATILLRDTWGEHTVQREVSFTPGKVTRIEWPRPAPQTVDVGGMVRSGGAPVANATVVVPDGARRRETKTDIGGRFRFDGIDAGRLVPVYVDAGTANERRTAVFHVAPQTGLSLSLPASPVDAVEQPDVAAATGSPFANCGVGDDQYPMVVAESVPSGATYQYSINWSDVTMTVQADRPGTYAFNVYATPFLFLQASVQVTSPAPATAPMTYIPPYDVGLQILNSKGFSMPQGLELSFSPPYEVAEWLDATELDLSSNSTVVLPCVNINPLALYINDGKGNGCDGDLTLTSVSCTIYLPADPTKRCACQ